ncbi:hypothetical protein PVAND_007652 [Polypedilum vanderplanki]|uniref:Poly(A) polymerase n=1 Tax=Polypedilum vanderplanki TaxID=319348 RepID=A0A9J6C7B9_POLVA|nr:hypothetical protein PVAND_007652 [Polypedilum vanderplanki]
MDFNDALNFDIIDQVVKYYDNEAKQLADEQNYQKLGIEIKNQIIFHNTTLYLYGSRYFQLGTDESDLDILIDSKDKAPIDVLKTLASSIAFKPNFIIKGFFPSTLVPCLRLLYLPQNICCDVTVNDYFGYCNSRVLKHLFIIQPEARYLFFFMKDYFTHNRVNVKGFLLAILVCFFLQKITLLPSLQIIQSIYGENIIKACERNNDYEKALKDYKICKMKDYKLYIISFFKFYTNFNFSDQIISIHFGKSFQREEYTQKYKFIRCDSPMCIADPINQGFNCARSIDSNKYCRFIKNCRHGVEMFYEDLKKVNIAQNKTV